MEGPKGRKQYKIGFENFAYESSSNEDDSSTPDEDYDDDEVFDKDKAKPIQANGHVTIEKEGNEEKEGKTKKYVVCLDKFGMKDFDCCFNY